MELDPFALSRGCLVCVLLPAPTRIKQSAYPLALAFAKQAQQFIEGEYAGCRCHVALFANGQQSTAAALLKLVKALPRAQVFARGAVLSDLYHLIKMLECGALAVQCADPRAHCVEIIPAPDIAVAMTTDGVEFAYIGFPCRYLKVFFHFSKLSRASFQDQVQAAAVEYRSSLCPFFRPSVERLSSPDAPPRRSNDAEIRITARVVR